MQVGSARLRSAPAPALGPGRAYSKSGMHALRIAQ